MEETRQELEAFFDDLLSHVRAFKKKTYEGLFEQMCGTYKELILKLETMCQEFSEQEQPDQIDTLASIIPDYAASKMAGVSKRNREVMNIDYNMTMAVYVIPVLTHTKDEYCDQLADAVVRLWNEKKITGLNLSKSSYEEIVGGFKQRLCYITTAVCTDAGKPDDCRELEVLRRYRDEYLMSSEEGRSLVEDYYETAPAIVMAIGMYPDASVIYQDIYQRYLEPCVGMAESGKNEACRELYMDMVQDLQRSYLHA